MNRRSLVRLAALMLSLGVLALAPALAQMASGSLRGKVTDAEGALPGVRVTLTSPALQGERAAITTATGDYIFPALPPGEYQVTFELAGYASVRSSVAIRTDQARQFDIELGEELVDEVTVTGSRSTVSTGTTAATSYEQDTIEKLPIARDINNTVALAPGVANTGPGGNAVISGALSSENLYLVNGVVVNENLRGQPFDLFIEDAIEEQTVQTGGSVSAEYGRFGGGVVNVLTKSGGNEFEGSFRTSFTNQDWEARTPIELENATPKEDSVNEVYEATFGGRVIRDRLWFFLAGRDRSEEETETTFLTNIPYSQTLEETRYEGKLTGAITSNHRVIGTYFEIDEEQGGQNSFGVGMDLAYLDTRTLPLTGWSANYTGVITPSFFVEGLYSEREFTFEGSGGDDRSFVGGTLFREFFGRGGRYNAPTFCGVCADEERNNENLRLKGSYFLTTEALGAHEIVFGYDTFTDIRLSDNHQSASDYQILNGFAEFDANNVIYPQMLPASLVGPGSADWVVWFPILGPSKGTDFQTNSFFVNDAWRLNENWSFNIGVRFDENDGVDAEGKAVIDDSRFSPRLGVTYDPRGDGEWLFTASYSEYVAAIANSVADSSSAAGTPATFIYLYDGPAINVADPFETPAREAMEIIGEWWFDTYGGPDNTDNLIFQSIPGSTEVIAEELGSPYSEEISIGVVKRLGTRGVIRADYVRRDFQDFYATVRNLDTIRPGDDFDRGLISNRDDVLERLYDGLQVAFEYQASEKLGIGATWTWSHLRGNINGETAGAGPISSSILEYPEFKELSWNAPRGDLLADQRHKIRAWAVYQIFATERQALSLSVLQSYLSGTPYSAAGNIVATASNPGYVDPPTNVVYFFSPRGAFTTPSITRTDLSFNYSFFFRDLELFVQPEILNIWNEDAFGTVNTTVLTAQNAPGSFDVFDPFTQEPIRGVHWDYGPDFGEPEAAADYQNPRTFRFSVGIRF